LYLASALQRIPLESRWEILAGMASHSEDAGDQNLPLMVWYAAEPLAEADPSRALEFGLSCGKNLPKVRDFMLRRVASLDSPEVLAALVAALGKSTQLDEQLAIIAAMRQALEGQRLVKSPAEWSSV
jgi:hypothetical protein